MELPAHSERVMGDKRQGMANSLIFLTPTPTPTPTHPGGEFTLLLI